MSPALREYSTTLLITATVTFLLTSVVRRLAVRIGAVPPARDRDVHAVPTPRMGGLAMYFGLLAGLIAARHMYPLQQVFSGTGLDAGLLGAGGLIVVVGVLDDRWGLPAIGKLAGQIAAGAILVASGARLDTFPIPHGQVFNLTPNESIVLTILVVVATINAVNFIDGLDGLAAGIVCIAAVSFFLYYYTLAKVGGLSAEGAPALTAVMLAGACLGFLPHNFHPAKIFMGDTGSMLLGLLLAYVPISAISQLDYMALPTTANRFPEILPLLLPMIVLVIPYADLLRAVIRRTRAGMSPLAADRQHLHHQMLAIGHSHRSSVLILYAWAVLFSAAVVTMSIVKTPLLGLAGITAGAVLVLALLSIPKLRWWERRYGRGPAVTESAAAVPAGAVPAAQPPGPVPVAESATGSSRGNGTPVGGREQAGLTAPGISPAVGYGYSGEPVPVAGPLPVSVTTPRPVPARRAGTADRQPRAPRFVPNPLADPLGLNSGPRFVPGRPLADAHKPRFVPASDLPGSEPRVSEPRVSEPRVSEPRVLEPPGVGSPAAALPGNALPGTAVPGHPDAAGGARPIARASGMIIP